MDITTFDARVTRQATESLRHSTSASLSGAEESAFAKHLQPRTRSARQSDPANSSSPAELIGDDTVEAPSVTDSPTTHAGSEERPPDEAETMTQPAPESTSAEERSSETDQDEIAAAAAAAAAQPSDAPPRGESLTTATGENITDNIATDNAETDPVAAEEAQDAAKLPDTAAADPAKPPTTMTGNAAAESIPADPDTTSGSPNTQPSTTSDSTDHSVQTTATAATIPTITASTVSATQNQASGGATNETAEKPAASAKTRQGKTAGKSSAAGNKDNRGESAADAQANPAATNSSDSSVSQISAAAELLPADTPSDRGTPTSQVLSVSNEVDAARDAQTRTQSLTERLPEQIFGKSSSAAGGSDELSSADQMRLIQRVARAMEVAPQNGGVLRLRLRPPELGAVRLEVAMQRGKMTARIETETAQARNVLLDQLPQLRERLEGQGIRIERFDVEVGPRDQGDSPSHSPHSEESYRSSTREMRPKPVETEISVRVAPETRRVLSATRVNVII